MYRSIARKAVVSNELKNALTPKVTMIRLKFSAPVTNLVMNPIIANTNVIVSTTDKFTDM